MILIFGVSLYTVSQKHFRNRRGDFRSHVFQRKTENKSVILRIQINKSPCQIRKIPFQHDLKGCKNSHLIIMI